MFIPKFFYSEGGIYPRFLIRSICAILTGVFLVLFGEDHLWDMLHNDGFYLSCIGSILISILMSEFITQVSYYFDMRYPWRKAIKKRLMFQGILCLLSICLAVMLATFYFMVRDTTILVANYFKYDFTVIIFLVVLMHAYYMILNLFKLKNSPFRRNLANNRQAPIPFMGPEAPAIIFSDGKHNFVFKFKGEKVQWEKTLELTINELPGEHYFLISRSEIVHRAAISHYNDHGSNTLQLTLRLNFKERALTVAQRRTRDFKEWFDGVGDIQEKEV